jgi:hypothetical protein
MGSGKAQFHNLMEVGFHTQFGILPVAPDIL